MVSCKHCGARNPEASLYCQDCGSRLGDWQPEEGPTRMPTPPTGLTRPESITCSRCGHANPKGMRFCIHCGAPLPEATTPEEHIAKVEPAPRICQACGRAGDAAASFCKHCGARYPTDDTGTDNSGTARKSADNSGTAHKSADNSGTAHKSADDSGHWTARSDPEARSIPYQQVPRSPAPSKPLRRGRLVSILKDGSDGRTYDLIGDRSDIGRREGDIILEDDPYLSDRHARIEFREGRPFLVDLDSVNGVYTRIREPVDLQNGDKMLLGQQVLRLEILTDGELGLGPALQGGCMVFGTPEAPRIARLSQYTTEGVGRDVHYLYRDETVIGREQGDLVFTDDPFMSRRHATLSIERTAGRFVLRDLGSSNGTAVCFRGRRPLRPGDEFRVGRNLFRFESGTGGVSGAR